jgi:hypothetical protein
MANYFPMALMGTTRSWLMNLPEGMLTYWQELCYQFTTNFESANPPPGNETDLHAIQQHPGESLRSFIQWFSQVYNTKKHGKKHYGETAHHPVGRLEKCLSSWCMGLRSSSPRKSPCAPSGSRHTMKPCRTSSSTKMLTLSTKEDGNLLLKIYGTTRRSDTISSGSCAAESSRWMI